MNEKGVIIYVQRILDNKWHTDNNSDDSVSITAHMYSDKECINYIGLCAAEINKEMLNSLQLKFKCLKYNNRNRIKWNIQNYNWDGFCYVENEDCIYGGMKKVNKLIITAI